MNNVNQPVYMIGIAAKLAGVHPQTLRQYEKLGLIQPSRVNAKNRLFSEADIQRVRWIQRLTQDLGINLAGVEVILRLLDDMEEMRVDLESQMEEFRQEAERRIQHLMADNHMPMKKNDSILPITQLRWKKFEF